MPYYRIDGALRRMRCFSPTSPTAIRIRGQALDSRRVIEKWTIAADRHVKMDWNIFGSVGNVSSRLWALSSLTYGQIDTCCINKESSAELSEAINSMYAWYEKAAICYAYLDDVSATVDTRSEDSELTNTTWATRGWTLQLCDPMIKSVQTWV